MSNSLTGSSLTLGIGSAEDIIRVAGSEVITTVSLPPVTYSKSNCDNSFDIRSNVTMPSLQVGSGSAVYYDAFIGFDTYSISLPASGVYLVKHETSGSPSITIYDTSDLAYMSGGSKVCSAGGTDGDAIIYYFRIS